VVIPYLIVRVGTPYAFLGWTGGGPPYTGVGLRVAVVKPVFTATAYSKLFGGSPSFYEFYHKHGNDPRTEPITTDLNLLNVSVVDGWGWSENLGRYIGSYVSDYGLGTIAAQSLTVLSDVNVTEGWLFNQGGSSKFDVVVLGFTEYATAEEYYAYQRFVASGGRLVIMDASNFVAEVKYYPETNHLALVRGHGWRFDGTKVWFDDGPFIRWEAENTNWVGSNQLLCCSSQQNRLPCSYPWLAWLAPAKYTGANVTGDYPISLALKQRFGPVVFRCYAGHEENSVTNMTGTTILARWPGPSLSPQSVIAAYLHRYINGTIVDIGVMSSDVVDQDMSVQFFLLSSIVDSTRTLG
jgi:hypothetical protein